MKCATSVSILLHKDSHIALLLYHSRGEGGAVNEFSPSLEAERLCRSVTEGAGLNSSLILPG